MTFNVILEGNFAWECKVDAKNAEEAKKAAEDLFDQRIGLLPDDYFVDSVSLTQEDCNS